MEISARTDEAASALAEIRDTALSSVRDVAKSTTKEIVKVLGGTTDAKEVTAAVSVRMKD